MINQYKLQDNMAHRCVASLMTLHIIVFMMVIMYNTMSVEGGSVLLPEGISPAEIEALPYDSSFGHAAEVYESGIAAAVVGLRRAMHEYPGIMYDEYFASETAYETLKLMGIEEHNIKTGLGVTGIVAVRIALHAMIPCSVSISSR